MDEFAADAGRNATGQIDRNAGPMSFYAVGIARPVQRGAGRDHEAVLGRTDRRRQNFVQSFRTIIGGKPAPGVDRTRNGDGMRRIVRDRHQPLLPKPAELGLRWCSA